MSLRPPMRFGYARINCAHGFLQRHGLFPAISHSMFRPNLIQRRCKVSGNSGATHSGKGKWSLHFNFERRNEAKGDREISLPLLIYIYGPWKMLRTKCNMWALKLFWDWGFAELKFVNNAKHALVLITRFIVEQHESHIKRCTTPMGYKQIKHDLINFNDNHTKLLLFDKRHILRAIPLKIQRLQHYDHKFAFIDMVFLACRRTNDFATKQEVERMQKLVAQYTDTTHVFVPNPIIFAEFFVRFRRDYSLPCTIHAGHWLISTYKILRLEVLNNHPEFNVGACDSGFVESSYPPYQKTTRTKFQ
ncbi:uncharacterized protein LOC111593716 [Drosophila hydei]|uniref:Uncharacterized protein LOC111593716 n=1 Tax=Drosophila hydei TaxID=7224 RepID=A0A6J1L7A3_DROHY|nr:uncharacterized protein LOC111593716 [Drosophila hydei]